MKKQNQQQQFQKKIVNGYQFVSILGKGSFGQVYKALKNEAVFAVKLIEKELVKRKKLEQYVDNEIKIMKELNSIYTVKLFDTFQDKQFLYIVMEYCNQGTLFQYVIENKPETQEGYKIFAQILRGFRAIHEKQFLHRDLKPDNIFIKDGIYKIADFGLSKPSAMGSTYCGTSYFMAPEILKYKPHNYKADLWSLGVIFYFMIFRDFPFKNKLGLLSEIEEKTQPFFDINKQLTKKWQKERINSDLEEVFKNIFVVNVNKRINFEQLYAQKVFDLIIDEEERKETQTLYKKIETLGTVKNSMFDKEKDKDKQDGSEEDDENFFDGDQKEEEIEFNEEQQQEEEKQMASQLIENQEQKKVDPFEEEQEEIYSEVHTKFKEHQIIGQQLHKPRFPHQNQSEYIPNKNDYNNNKTGRSTVQVKQQDKRESLQEAVDNKKQGSKINGMDSMKQSQNTKLSARKEFQSSVKQSMELDILEHNKGVERQTDTYLFEIGKYNLLGDAVNEIQEIQLGPSSRALLNYLFSKLLIFFAMQIKNSLLKKENIFNVPKFDQFCNSDSYKQILETVTQDIKIWHAKFQLFYYGMDLDETVKSTSVKKIFSEEIVETDYKKELKQSVQLVLSTTFKAAFNLGLNMKNPKKQENVLRSSLIILMCQYIDEIFEPNQIRLSFPLYFIDHDDFSFLQLSIWICKLNKDQVIKQIQQIVINKQGQKQWNHIINPPQKKK